MEKENTSFQMEAAIKVNLSKAENKDKESLQLLKVICIIKDPF